MSNKRNILIRNGSSYDTKDIMLFLSGIETTLEGSITVHFEEGSKSGYDTYSVNDKK